MSGDLSRIRSRDWLYHTGKEKQGPGPKKGEYGLASRASPILLALRSSVILLGSLVKFRQPPGIVGKGISLRLRIGFKQESTGRHRTIPKTQNGASRELHAGTGSLTQW